MTMVKSHVMESMAISEFKATCLAVVERVRASGESILITRRGEPVAEVVPTSRPAGEKRKLGTMAGTTTIVGDIVSPISDPSDWDVLRD